MPTRTRSTKRALAEADVTTVASEENRAKQARLNNMSTNMETWKEKQKEQTRKDTAHGAARNYAAMLRENLARLCKDRGLIHSGSKVKLVEALEAADRKKSNPDAESAKAAGYKARNTDRGVLAQRQLKKETGRTLPLDDRDVQMSAHAIGLNESAKEEGISWHHDPRRYLVDVANMRGLACGGTNEELERMLTADDAKDHPINPTYIQKAIDATFTNSPAYARTVDILTQIEFEKKNREDPLPHPGGGLDEQAKTERYLRQRACKAVAVSQAEPIVREIAKTMASSKEKINSDVLGARCLHRLLPEWVAKGNVGAYSKLHVGELKELLRLRDQHLDLEKPRLVEQLMISDYQKFSGPKPPQHILKQCMMSSFQRDEYEPPAHAEVVNAEHIAGAAASPSELESNESPVPDELTRATKAAAQKINATLGDYRVHVDSLQPEVVKELCKTRKIRPPETALCCATSDDLREHLDQYVKKANLRSEVYLKRIIQKTLADTESGRQAIDIYRKQESTRLVSLSENPIIRHTEASRSAKAILEEQIRKLAQDYNFMVDRPDLQGAEFDEVFFGSKLLCGKLDAYVGKQGKKIDYK